MSGSKGQQQQQFRDTVKASGLYQSGDEESSQEVITSSKANIRSKKVVSKDEMPTLKDINEDNEYNVSLGDAEENEVVQKMVVDIDENMSQESEEETKAKEGSKRGVIVPKAGKGGRNLALLEEIKQREAKSKNDTKSRLLITEVKVDKDCELKSVSVLEDYSCLLQQNEISYNDDQLTRYLVIQLLERTDGKKWQVWTKQGKIASDTFTKSVKDFYNKHDAMVEFESLFLKKTSNKWGDRQYFQQKPGMYMLIRKDSEREVVQKYAELEKEIIKLISEGTLPESGLVCKFVKSESVASVVLDAWNMDVMKRVMAGPDMSLDLERLPLGRL